MTNNLTVPIITNLQNSGALNIELNLVGGPFLPINIDDVFYRKLIINKAVYAANTKKRK
jgi:hypothetical protein